MRTEKKRTVILLASINSLGEVIKHGPARFRSIGELYRTSGDARFIVVADKRGRITVFDLIDVKLQDLLIDGTNFKIEGPKFKTLHQAIAATIIANM